MKKSGLLILTLFLFSFVSALTATQDSLDVAVIPEFNQPGKTNITIDNVASGNYNIYTLTAVKLMPEEPFSLYSGSNNIEVSIYPTEDLNAYGPAAYTFVYYIRSLASKENFENKMTVRVVSIDDALEVSSDSNSPDSESITFFIRNRETIDLKDVKAHFSSIFFDIDETFDLKANEKKEISVPISKDKLKEIEAGAYLLKADFETDRGVRTIEGRVYLGEKKGIEAKETTDGFFIKRTDISRINYGNVNEQVSIEVKKNVFSRLFTSFNVAPDVVNRDGFGVYYSWSRKLGPADSLDVEVTTNYLYPFLILVAIVLLIIGVRRYTETKIEVIKSVVPVKTQSGHFALRVRLNVRARKAVQNVSLIDRIPGVVQVHEKFDSMIKPSKIDIRNRRIQWDLSDMSAGEERAFNYVVYSTVGVVGKFVLPKALAVFEKSGNIHEVESNSVFFLAEQRALDE